jgi:hypothetical protein
MSEGGAIRNVRIGCCHAEREDRAVLLYLRQNHIRSDRTTKDSVIEIFSVGGRTHARVVWNVTARVALMLCPLMAFTVVYTDNSPTSRPLDKLDMALYAEWKRSPTFATKGFICPLTLTVSNRTLPRRLSNECSKRFVVDVKF